jgi:hypothetical protein
MIFCNCRVKIQELSGSNLRGIRLKLRRCQVQVCGVSGSKFKRCQVQIQKASGSNSETSGSTVSSSAGLNSRDVSIKLRRHPVRIYFAL